MDAITDEKRVQVLLSLRAAPLDRIRLMKTLFLFWYRHRDQVDGPFHFEPYLYGPCAFDLYSTLDDLDACGFVSRNVSSNNPRWAPYHLTPSGAKLATKLARKLPKARREELFEIATWAASRGFSQLLRDVYAEAPEFATKTVFR